jgi:pyrroloquinoline quinone biosynthesis protein E
VRDAKLAEIWLDSPSFNVFRGVDWLPEPCRSCPEKESDFGGCRCQAELIGGAARGADPVCSKSPQRPLVDAVIEEASRRASCLRDLIARQNPQSTACAFAPKIS